MQQDFTGLYIACWSLPIVVSPSTPTLSLVCQIISIKHVIITIHPTFHLSNKLGYCRKSDFNQLIKANNWYTTPNFTPITLWIKVWSNPLITVWLFYLVQIQINESMKLIRNEWKMIQSINASHQECVYSKCFYDDAEECTWLRSFYYEIKQLHVHV